MSDAADIAGEAQALVDEQTAARLAQEQAARSRQVGSDYCLECGFDIPAARRQAAPWATRCIECQQYVDQLARRYR